MTGFRLRVLIGVAVGMALAFGASPDLRAAAKAAAAAGAKAASATATAAKAAMGGTTQKTSKPGQTVKDKKQLVIDRQKAAKAAAAKGFIVPSIGALATATMAIPGSQPDYYGMPNWANSPWPVLTGPQVAVGNPLVDRAFASDYAVGAGQVAPVFVLLPQALPAGMLTGFQTWNQATPGGSPFPSAGNVFHAYVLRPTGVANQYTVVFDSGQLTVPALTDPAVSQIASFAINQVAVQAGDRIGFYGQGIPVDTGTGTDTLCYPANTLPVGGTTITVGGTDFPVYPDARTYSFAAQVIDMTNPTIPVPGTGLRKFQDKLPFACTPGGDCPTDGSRFIPFAIPDQATYACANILNPAPNCQDADYYEIGLVQTREQMHKDLPATLLREYVQLAKPGAAGAVQLFNEMLNGTKTAVLLPDGSPAYGVTAPHFLGPIIVAHKNKPVRILFRNLLPGGKDGDLFVPVDTTFMGAGKSPDLAWGETDPLNPYCNVPGKLAGCFTDTRATLHLHGGMSPWISDGTPHQWVTSNSDATPYTKGLSARNVPDMWFDASSHLLAASAGCQGHTTCATTGATNDPGKGSLTFFYTNQQSARLMFYHDHAFGITRLNVYVGQAAGYLVTDNMEQALTTGTGPLASVGVGIPLVVQDRTFVPDNGDPGGQLASTDPLWDVSRWGGKGSLWLPHVYMPIQNPGSTQPSGFGRWFYGPWFWPPATPMYGPVANQYYASTGGAACDPAISFCQPATVPGTPYLSSGMEAFHDTPLVNGTAYPTVTLEPKAYRFRILNAANDRFFNLQWYLAVDKNGVPCDGSTTPVPESTGVACTEVALNATEVAAALTDPAGVIPHVNTAVSKPGPSWVQIGTEGGFLPTPAVIPNQEITYVTDPGRFDVGNVDLHSLLLGSAERADVIVDFSQYAGKTLILYNDAPAAFPARDPRYDLYTGNADQRDVGGPPTTLPGYGPNTRTVMQVKIGTTVTTAASVDMTALNNAFAHHTDPAGNPAGVFEASQHPIIVGQAAYNTAYGTKFAASNWCDDPSNPNNVCDGFARIAQQGGDLFGFNTLAAPTVKSAIPLQPKGMHDEPNAAAFDEYGRMTANLGLEAKGATPLLQNIILYPYPNPPTELIDGTNLPKGSEVTVQKISSMTDGTQIWKITHNGVDTHPIHFHLYDVQVLNRSPWDGQIILPPDANELGWKDTVRISPLEDTYVALRPVVPVVPFDVPNSIRLLNPMMAQGSDVGFNNTDPNGNPTTTPIVNVPVNFGWEYVWHCHILSHEEMDMMRPQVLALPPNQPVVTYTKSSSGKSLTVAWTDNSLNETGWVVQRDTGTGWTTIDTITSTTPDTYGATAISRSYTLPTSGTYAYRVVAQNTVGYGGSFPSMTAQAISTTVYSSTTAAPLAPTALTGTVQAGPQVALTFTDNATNESGFVLERCTGAGCTTFAKIAQLPARTNTGSVSYTDTTVAANTTYVYRVAAVNTVGTSTYATTGNIVVPAPPAVPLAPSNVKVVNKNNTQISITWVDNATNETGYTVQVATDSAFATIVGSANVAANATTASIGGLTKGTYYYARVRANNGTSSSAWVNAAPFPILK